MVALVIVGRLRASCGQSADSRRSIKPSPVDVIRLACPRPPRHQAVPVGGPGQASKLAVLLDSLDGVAISDAERASLAWLAGFEAHTVANIAAVITRARQTR